MSDAELLHSTILPSPESEDHKPVLVMLHGLFGSNENLGMLARLLSTHFTVHLPDLPNHGKSFHSSEMNLDAMASAVADYLVHHNIDSCYLLGHSLGGKVAMNFILNKPDQARDITVEGLVVLDISPRAYQPGHEQIFAGLLDLNARPALSRKEADDRLSAYVKELPVRSFLLKNLRRSDSGEYVLRCNIDILFRDYQQILGKISANKPNKLPALFFKGGDSDYIKDTDVAIRALFPNAIIVNVPNTGHWLHAQEPKLIAEKTIGAFM